MKIAFLILTFDEISIHDYLSQVIDGIKQQIIDADVDVLFVDNLSSDSFRGDIKKECDENNWECISIPHTRYPIQVCKNIGWKWFTKNGAKYDYYAFCSDDIVMNCSDHLQNMINSFTPTHGVLVPYLRDAAPERRQKKVAKQAHMVKKNIDELSHSLWAYTHFSIYSNEFFEKFNYKEIDIMWNLGYSQLLVYLCKSVEMKWKWCCQLSLYNARKHSSKNLPNRRETNTGSADDLHTSPDPKPLSPYVIFDNKVADFDLASNAARFDAIFSKGTEIGLGWHRPEGGPSVIQYVPDASNYDGNGKHKDPEKLHKYIMEHLFLSNEALNYEELLNSAHIVRLKK